MRNTLRGFQKKFGWLALLLCAGGLVTLGTSAAGTDSLIFLSTQLRPIEEAQKMRNLILKNYPGQVDYITEEPQRLLGRIEESRKEPAHAIDVVGALHGELQPLASLDALTALDSLAGKLAHRGIPKPLLALGKLGTTQQLYIPWMQASYIMVANRRALPFLPDGANVNALSYDELAAWAGKIQQETGKRLLGFPAGPQGLMHRFFEGFLYPSYTGGVVAPFRSEAAETMWMRFASLWANVNPNSTSYNFMHQPLLSGEVWIAFDHIARVLDALRRKPEEFIAFPAPSGPKGRGYMPVLAGLAVVKGTPNMDGAMALIDYLTQPETQIATMRSVGFFPVVSAQLPADLEPGLKLAATAMENMQTAKDALPASPPIGLGQRDRDFDRVFMETFQLIVLRGQSPRAVLDREAEALNRLMSEASASCWQPDPAGPGNCRAQMTLR